MILAADRRWQWACVAVSGIRIAESATILPKSQYFIIHIIVM